MGWQERDWYLGEHRSALFDTNGNAGPTIWADGRIVGGWATRAGGEVVTELLEDVGREASQAVDAEAARTTELLQASRSCLASPGRCTGVCSREPDAASAGTARLATTEGKASFARMARCGLPTSPAGTQPVNVGTPLAT